jgi:hypothetical protein
MKFSRLIAMTCLSLLLAGPTWAQEENQTEKKEQKEVCPHPRPWKPTADEMQRILADHAEWVRIWEEVAKYPGTSVLMGVGVMPPGGGRANLCNLQWQKIKIDDAHLAGVQLNRANLQQAELNNADLRMAELNNAYLFNTQLNSANLEQAQLNNVSTVNVKLNNANLDRAQLNNAFLINAELNNAKLFGTQLNNAKLLEAKLNNAILLGAELNNADLRGAQLKGAILVGVSLTGAKLAGADLTNASYAPQPGTPDPDVAGIKGLDTVRIQPGQETGLVQLRDLLQKGGLRDLEREATFTIEYWRTRSGTFIERFFRIAVFEWTTGYGLYPGRALKIIAVFWLLLSLIYFWPIYLGPKGSSTGGIYQVWPGDRIETSGEAASLSNSTKVNRLKRGPLGASGYAAYFSLLSAFYIGWRELNVGSWIARMQPREYTLRATGWVRVISGVQSLLSVYLLAIWVLTYFGRPFQ